MSQLAFVPVYLSYWTSETYGVWLALQAFYTVSTIFGMAYLTFLENEFIRIGISDILTLRRTLWSSVPIGFAIATVQLVVVLVLVKSGVFSRLLLPHNVADRSLEAAAGWIAIAQLGCWLLIVATTSAAVRALSGIGHYARYAWLGLPYVILNALVPVIVVIRGGNLLEAGLSQVGTTFAFNAFWLFDSTIVAKRHGIAYSRPELKLSLNSLHKSIYILLRLFLEMARQTGFRLVMLPAVGPTKLAEFSTQRTAGNTAMQCMNSVYAPLLPELMRYVRDRKQEHMEGAFNILWLLLVLILCPLTVLLQSVMPTIFPWWTRRAFDFDAILFCCLSTTVLINMVSLPAVAVSTGSNLVTVQLRIAAVAATVLFTALIPLTHFFGIRGAALSLLVCETSATLAYVRYCSRWLKDSGLSWPTRPFSLCLISVLQTAIFDLCIAAFPKYLVFWLVMTSAAWTLLSFSLWKATPNSAKNYLMSRLARFRVPTSEKR